jgi:serine protease inhibitor
LDAVCVDWNGVSAGPAATVGGKLEQELTAERLEGWVEALQEKRVSVALPLFEMKTTTPLVGPLQ